MIHLLSTLAESWRPFLDPLDLHRYWWAFLFPLALGVSIVYRAVRVRSMQTYFREVALMTFQIIFFMALLWVVSLVFVRYLLPLIVPMGE